MTRRQRWRRLKTLGIAFCLSLLISLGGGTVVSFLFGLMGILPPLNPSLLAAQQFIQMQRPALSQTVSQTVLQAVSQTVFEKEQIGRQLYRDGQFVEAIALWQQIVQIHAAQQNSLGQASALSNLALSYQQLGEWDSARQAIAAGLALINKQHIQTTDQWSVLAQLYMTQGSLQAAVGQPEQALETWQQAASAYQHSSDDMGLNRAQINQARALQSLGFYRQSLEKLRQVGQAMESQPPSQLKAIALRRLGEALRLSGQLSAAQTALTQSLAIAEQLSDPGEISATLLSLGNTAQSMEDTLAAQDFYEQAIVPSLRPRQLIPIQLAQLELAIKTSRWSMASELWPVIQTQFDDLPVSRSAIYHQVNWASSLVKLTQSKAATEVEETVFQAVVQQLRQAVEQARSLSDRRAEAYALGTLGQVYEQTQQWAQARALTQQALALSTAEHATDISYQWHWQLGRLWNNPNNPEHSVVKAIEAYQQAVDTLSYLRGDLAAADSSAQFSFAENVEPIYRQLAGLLLTTDSQAPASSQNLVRAQNVIESLRLAELDNYFQEACVDTTPIDINQADPNAAIVYTLVLEDRLSVILHLPHQPLQQFSTEVSAGEVSDVAKQLRQQLVIRSQRRYLPLSQQIYSWLVEPARSAIDRSGVETLVFVLDGPLQNIPVASLYDGHRFLIEDYALALTPGLKLLNPKAWNTSNLSVLTAGVTQSRQGLAPLPYVDREIKEITDAISNHTVLLNQNFTEEALSKRLKSTLYPIVHMATHGQFGSTAEETYLVAWDKLIGVQEISQMLQANLGNRGGIDLLVLSACETARGDRQAALGLAGVAIKAGAQSTIGSLWAINDEASSLFVGYFYEQLVQPGATRAGSLREAQLRLLQDPQYRHPIYWAPYILLGSWL
ncbi:MAG: CHAT domain-containing protein [Phormidesmis sp.]